MTAFTKTVSNGWGTGNYLGWSMIGHDESDPMDPPTPDEARLIELVFGALLGREVGALGQHSIQIDRMNVCCVNAVSAARAYIEWGHAAELSPCSRMSTQFFKVDRLFTSLGTNTNGSALLYNGNRIGTVLGDPVIKNGDTLSFTVHYDET